MQTPGKKDHDMTVTSSLGFAKRKHGDLSERKKGNILMSFAMIV